MWTAATFAALLLSGLIGLSLGLVGGGGSIITVPVLVYVAGLSPKDAVPMSLAIVGATAAVGAAVQARSGLLDLRAAAMFGGAGIAGAWIGSPFTRMVPPPVLMLVFAALMVGVGARMLTARGEDEPEASGVCRPAMCLAAGLGVGILTGFLGVGGGFLIVPALLRFARMPMPRAAATSLLIIAVNSAAGLAAHSRELHGSVGLAAAFTGVAVVGLLGGLLLARRMRPSGLKAAFGGLALVVAAYLVVMNASPAFVLFAPR